jgi:hypothetical protein
MSGQHYSCERLAGSQGRLIVSGSQRCGVFGRDIPCDILLLAAVLQATPLTNI